MEHTLVIRATAPTGRTDTIRVTFSTNDNIENAVCRFAKFYGEELISDMFDLDFLSNFSYSDEEIESIEEEKWADYLRESQIEWKYE